MRSGSTVQREESDSRTGTLPHQRAAAHDALPPPRLEHAGALSGTLLDIGSGIGSLTFGLLERGVTRAVAVDASFAYNQLARQEAARLGRADAVHFVHADFVSATCELPAATLVTLDRVVCCYPSYEALLNAALRHADQCLALSYPRDVWYVRLGVMLENAQRRLTKNSFLYFRTSGCAHGSHDSLRRL